MPPSPVRKFGFPLFMVLGFAAAAFCAVVLWVVLGAGSPEGFQYAVLFKLMTALGGLGLYLGHIAGATRNPDAGFQPFGPLNQWVVLVGSGMLLVGSAAVMAAVIGVMTILKGHPPPH